MQRLFGFVRQQLIVEFHTRLYYTIIPVTLSISTKVIQNFRLVHLIAVTTVSRLYSSRFLTVFFLNVGHSKTSPKNWKCYRLTNYSAHLSFWIWWLRISKGEKRKGEILLSTQCLCPAFWIPRVIICMHEFHLTGWVTFITQLNYRPKSHLSIFLNNLGVLFNSGSKCCTLRVLWGTVPYIDWC